VLESDEGNNLFEPVRPVTSTAGVGGGASLIVQPGQPVSGEGLPLRELP
jgi:hypothetical protein